jgi:hypothetical protein
MNTTFKALTLSVLVYSSFATAAEPEGFSAADGQAQARRLLAGPHDSLDPAPVPAPRLAKAAALGGQEHAQSLFQPVFVTRTATFESAAARADSGLDGHAQARGLWQH